MQNFALQNEQFVHFVEQSCERAGKTIAFYTKSIVDLILTRGNVAGYCDGTFRFFPAYFNQLLIIHINVGNHVSKILALLFNIIIKNAFSGFCMFLLSYGKKSTEAYVDVFSHMSSLGIVLKELVMDFESSMRKGALCAFPNVKLSGCHFHLGQSLHKNMQKLCDHPDYSLLRKMQALALLPANIIKETYLELKGVLLEFYEKMVFQLKDYINSDFQKKIRLSNKRTEKFQKEAVIKRLYSKLEKGMTGLQFVENVYSGDYEKLFKEVLEERNSRPEAEWNEFSDESSDEDETSLVRKCECCHNIRRIEGGFAACLHIILCRECVIKVNEHCRLSNGKVACIRCRKQNDEAKLAYY
ncbi:hypothetical protein PVAND_014544 [Polypedilum vanderplanki]|uniref:Uncharacterized protein n=1 Tax=Polypedilum vanderplanki TaxID=319348 RepID=A0A9J6BAH8_POLVA|nr:hypothetical protein PVAND_014544 [Polypedilum vanderplanki]